jgi:hypothetical protein
MKDHIKSFERLKFAWEKEPVDWFEVIKCGLFFILFVSLIMLCFAPFMWK